ncbi:MAG: hypothetical protein ACRCS9_00885, partial [Hyphomicrobium sp.]
MRALIHAAGWAALGFSLCLGVSLATAADKAAANPAHAIAEKFASDEAKRATKPDAAYEQQMLDEARTEAEARRKATAPSVPADAARKPQAAEATGKPATKATAPAAPVTATPAALTNAAPSTPAAPTATPQPAKAAAAEPVPAPAAPAPSKAAAAPELKTAVPPATTAPAAPAVTAPPAPKAAAVATPPASASPPAVAAPSPANTPAPAKAVVAEATAAAPAKSSAATATVLVVLTGAGQGADAAKGTADPILCFSDTCYVSAGSGVKARAVPKADALSVKNTIGDSAGACTGKSHCTFRDIPMAADTKFQVV